MLIIIIRKIDIKDASKFLSMLKQLDNETKNMLFEPGERKTTLDEMESKIDKLKSSDSLILVAQENDDIVGFLSADRGFANRIKHSAYIVIGILKDFRGKRIGSMLFKELDKWARNSGITRLELTVMTNNVSGIKLYETMGFKKEGLKEKSIILDGEYVDEYYMAKILL